MSALCTLLVFLLLPLAVFSVPLAPVASKAEQSSLAPQIMSVFTSPSLSADLVVAPEDRKVITELAGVLFANYETVTNEETIDIGIEDAEFEAFASWKDTEASARCMDLKEYKKRLTNMFKLLTSKLDLGKREARSLLREIYHMARTHTVGAEEVKCLTNANYREIVDLLVVLKKTGQTSQYVIVPQPVDATSANVVDSAAKKIVSDASAVFQTFSPEATATVAVPGLVRTTYPTCPYHYQQCCIFYDIPNIQNREQMYLQCCFEAFYPQINADWDLYFADIYPEYTPEEYTLLYCMLPSV